MALSLMHNTYPDYTPAQSNASYTTINLEAQITDVYGKTALTSTYPHTRLIVALFPEEAKLIFRFKP